MSTDDERRADGHDDPTAPPPYPVEPPQPPADPTQPIGTETRPFAAPSVQGEQPAPPPPPPWSQDPGTTPVPPPADPYATPVPPSNPYAAPVPPPNPYAAPAPPPGGYPYAAPPTAYASTPSNNSALVLTILSGVSVVLCGGLFVIPALIFGIVGLTKQSSDPAGSDVATRRGWWAFGIGVAVSVLLVIVIVIFFVATASNIDGSYEPSYDGY